MPLMAPVLALRSRPGGSAGSDVKVSVDEKKVASLSGGGSAAGCERIRCCVLCSAAGSESRGGNSRMRRLSAVLAWPAGLVAVTVNAVAVALAASGVPSSAPVAALKLTPAGRSALGAMLKAVVLAGWHGSGPAVHVSATSRGAGAAPLALRATV